MKKETMKNSLSKERMLFEKLANSNFTEEVTCFVSYDKE